MTTRRTRRLRIDRLEIDLRGMAPDTAATTASALGAALARELASGRPHLVAAERVDAGRVTSPAAPGAPPDGRGLADTIARRVAARIRGEGA